MGEGFAQAWGGWRMSAACQCKAMGYRPLLKTGTRATTP